jgi:hypothetical protein
MAAARVFIFAPADKDGDTHRQLERAGCELAATFRRAERLHRVGRDRAQRFSFANLATERIV